MISWSTSDVVGVEFGDNCLMAARVTGKGDGHLSLTHAGWRKCSPSAPERDIASALRALWKESGMPTRTVCASLRSASLVMRYFKYPAMPDVELQSALQLQAEEALQMPRDHMVVDWHRVDREATENSVAQIEGVWTAAPLVDVERQLDILFMAGLDPVVLDVRAMAVANLHMVLNSGRDREQLCVVNMCPHSADVIIVPLSGGVYPHTIFCRASTWGDAPGFLSENIRDVLRYSEFKLDWKRVRRVMLTGAVPEVAGFTETVAAGLGLPVEIWNPLPEMHLKHGVDQSMAGMEGGAMSFACCLGLGLRKG